MPLTLDLISLCAARAFKIDYLGICGHLLEGFAFTGNTIEIARAPMLSYYPSDLCCALITRGFAKFALKASDQFLRQC